MKKENNERAHTRTKNNRNRTRTIRGETHPQGNQKAERDRAAKKTRRNRRGTTLQQEAENGKSQENQTRQDPRGNSTGRKLETQKTEATKPDSPQRATTS